MTTGLLLLGALALIVYVALALNARNRIMVTVARSTTTDGETCQLSGSVKDSLTAMEINAHIEKMSLAIQGRIESNNELVLTTQLKNAHAIWLKIRSKVDAGAKLSNQEAKFWAKVSTMFDENGLKPEFTREKTLEVVKRLDVLDETAKAA